MATEHHETGYGQVLARLKADRIVERIFARDHTLWSDSPAEIADRLGWLDCPQNMQRAIPELTEFAAEIQAAGIRDVVVLGMGGSSLAAEVMRQVCISAPGYPALQVIDTTDPLTIAARTRQLDAERTLFIAATKSGGTIETMSLLKYFFSWSVAALGAEAAAQHFVAITDSASGLEQLALSLNFRRIFLNDAEIGGRFAALSYFGLVPAALVGIDIAELLNGAEAARRNPSPELGAFLGSEAAAGRNKLIVLADAPLKPFGVWLEQLIAESSGKDGQGIVPVIADTWLTPQEYAPDCCFVALVEAADSPAAQHARLLAESGRNVQRVDFPGAQALGAQFYNWELATAIACHVLGVQPFDQPDVEQAKVLAREFMAQRAGSGTAADEPQLTADGIGLISTAQPCDRLEQALQQPLAVLDSGGYICLQAFLPMLPEVETLLAELAGILRAQSGRPVTYGFGPRYLHSTGQLHKGGPAGGLYIQLTCADKLDLPIPDDPLKPEWSVTFGALKQAQAAGDFQALAARGRTVVRCHLNEYLLGLTRLICIFRTQIR